MDSEGIDGIPKYARQWLDGEKAGQSRDAYEVIEVTHRVIGSTYGVKYASNSNTIASFYC